MGIVETLVEEVIKRLFSREGNKQRADKWSPERLRLHLIEVANWSSRIEFGLTEARSTDADTIALFTALPRKFRGAKTSRQTSSELELLVAPGNIVLLGDPGAGKTTTLKRIGRMLLSEPTLQLDTAAYPVLVRLRDLDTEILLEEVVGRALGMPTRRELPKPSDRTRSVRKQQRSSIDVVKIMSGQVLALDAFAEIANESGAMFLFDGLDEVRPEIRNRTDAAIVELARKLETARLRVTCRSGDYAQQLEGFDPFELCPLDHAQVATIISRWCSEPKEFATALDRLPFRDLASRPLFLCELIVLFEKTGFLPLQPSAVYRRIVLLALEEWDRRKRVPRRSRYAGFDPSRKFEFLANLAFHLTYVTQQKYFTPHSFALAYNTIRHAFALPEGEASNVFEELESHTGIIVEVGFERYEFSHLSLQEFLAADFLIRDRISKETIRQLIVNPAPLAVSVAMSSNPSQRLAALLLSDRNGAVLSEINLDSFFSRIAQEHVLFQTDMLLGFAALAIIFASVRPLRFIDDFLRSEVVQMSIALALKAYYLPEMPAPESDIVVRLRAASQEAQDLPLPRGGMIPRSYLNPLLAKAGLRIEAVETLMSESDTFGTQYFFIGKRQLRL
ncbi:MAG TPA: NACHT domain-containing protein [Thermoanaerobaculia bacterium]|nr:NACHT domain-containing protein [Thermoanaerobaculia bacterium]